jgi:hypothetical protein
MPTEYVAVGIRIIHPRLRQKQKEKPILVFSTRPPGPMDEKCGDADRGQAHPTTALLGLWADALKLKHSRANECDSTHHSTTDFLEKAHDLLFGPVYIYLDLPTSCFSSLSIYFCILSCLQLCLICFVLAYLSIYLSIHWIGTGGYPASAYQILRHRAVPTKYLLKELRESEPIANINQLMARNIYQRRRVYEYCS